MHSERRSGYGGLGFHDQREGDAEYLALGFSQITPARFLTRRGGRLFCLADLILMGSYVFSFPCWLVIRMDLQRKTYV